MGKIHTLRLLVPCLPQTGVEVLGVLRELQRTGDQTLIMVTHDPQIAGLADRRVHLEQERKFD